MAKVTHSIRWNYYLLMACVVLITSVKVTSLDSIDDTRIFGFGLNLYLNTVGIAAGSVAWIGVRALTSNWDTWTYFLVCSLAALIFVSALTLYREFTIQDYPFIQVFFGSTLIAMFLLSFVLFLVSLPIQWIWSRFWDPND